MSPPAAGTGMEGGAPPALEGTGLDGYTEDDVPMMQVGPPTIAPPHQVTTKPRQMPGGSGGTPGGMPGQEGQFGQPDDPTVDDEESGLDFDPSSTGQDVAERHEESTTDPDAGPPKPEAHEAETTKPEPKIATLPTWRAMADQILASNPGLDPREAKGLAAAALGQVLRAEGIYEYDPSAWGNGFRTHDSIFSDYLNDFAHKQRSQQAQPAERPRSRPGRPQSEPGRPNQNPNPLLHPSSGEQWVKDRSKKVVDWAQQRLKGRPLGPPGQGDPLPPNDAEPAKPAQPAVPGVYDLDDNPEPPKTMGEWARRTMKAFPSTQGDLWHHRHDGRPYKPEGYPPVLKGLAEGAEVAEDL